MHTSLFIGRRFYCTRGWKALSSFSASLETFQCEIGLNSFMRLPDLNWAKDPTVRSSIDAPELSKYVVEHMRII